MSLRIKLTLGFIIVSLAIVVAFSVIAYTSAQDYTRDIELNHLHKNNTHLFKMMNESAPTLDELERIINRYKSNNNNYSIINTSQNQIISGSNATLNTPLLAAFLSLPNNTEKWQGGFTVNEKEYMWVADPIFNSPYAVANIYHRDSNNLGTLLTYIGIPLGITLFFSIWVSLWASTIIANLFQEVAEKNTQLEHQFKHDPLTDLPNRNTIGWIVQQALTFAKEANEKLLFCLVDIDALKEINDSLGHESGDILLNQVTQRLKHTLKQSDQIGRFGGNKFAIIIKHSNLSSIENICHQLLENFEPTYEINGHSIYVRATLGLATYPDHATGAQELIQKTETALHKAKKLAVPFNVYDISQDSNSAERLRLTHDLRNAIKNEELQLHYQPQFDVRKKVICGVEALARWIHPQHGFIPPDNFIELAEQTGLIQPLTDWVLRTAIKQCAEWNEMGNNLTISVNLSARNLHDETLSTQISNLLTYWNVPPEKLCLEITETAMMTDPEHAKKLLDGLDRLGVRLSIDDFGTGYSSLGYLKQLPVDELKVDKSFVLNMAKDENDASIVRATVSLAHDLGLEVVAEGVEDQISQDELSRLGCEYIQGYHIARPMPHEDITASLAASKASNDDHIDIPPASIHPAKS